MFSHFFEQIEQIPASNGPIQSIFGGENQKRPQYKLLFNKNRKQYYWNNCQQRRYILFIKQSIKTFQLSVQERKRSKVDYRMSQKVKTRSATQCHSHHQKMIRKHKNIEGIIENHLHLFDDNQIIDIKKILKENFGEKKSINQLLDYSKNILIKPNQIIINKDQNQFFKPLEEEEAGHFYLNAGSLMPSPFFSFEDRFDLHQRYDEQME